MSNYRKFHQFCLVLTGFSEIKNKTLSHLPCGCNLCSGLCPGRGEGRGDPGQLAAAGDIAANGLLSG